MSVATAAPMVRTTRFWTRARGFGVFYLLVALIVLIGAITRVDPDIISRLGLGIIGKPPPVRISLPTQASLIVIGILLGLAGTYSLLRSPNERAVNALLGASFGLIVLAALIAAAAGKSIDGYIGTFSSEHQTDALPYATASPGYQSNFSFEFHNVLR